MPRRDVWYGMMRIPFGAVDARPPEKGRELRIGLFRISGANPRQRHTWRATDGTTFHVPQGVRYACGCVEDTRDASD